MPDENALAYFAGFFDGEGTAYIAKNGSISIAVTNSHKPTLEYLQQLFGGTLKFKAKTKNKQCYSLCWYGLKAYELCCVVYDFLITKKKAVKFLIDWMEERSQYRHLHVPGIRGSTQNTQRQERLDWFRKQVTEEVHAEYL